MRLICIVFAFLALVTGNPGLALGFILLWMILVDTNR